MRGGFALLTDAQNEAADHGYGALSYVHDAANWPRNVCLGVYHGPERAAA